MKNKIKDFILFTILVIYFIYCITNNLYIKNQIIYSFNIWITKIIPSLFPIFIIVDIIYNSNIPLYIEKYFSINTTYILSIISGSPSNAYILNKYNTDITKQLSITKYTSPIFTYYYLKAIFNHKIALILICTNILSNIILSLLIKPKNIEYKQNNKQNIFMLLSTSIKNNINNLITILGTIIFFNTLPINLINNKYIKTLILSILEITTSLDNLSTITLPFNIKLLFTSISISTCGLCIETQIKSIVNDTHINYKKYITYRLLHLIIFLMLNYIILYLL